MTRLERLTAIALELYEGQVDKQGRPYSEHILGVMEAVSRRAKPVALFHDAIEDRRMEPRCMIPILGLDEQAAVASLTRYNGEPYCEYIARVASAPGVAGNLAREVKVADLRHNLSRLTPELESLRSRYEKALRTLGADPETEVES